MITSAILVASLVITLSVYELAASVTGAPAHIMRGIAVAESDELDEVIGDQGRSRGRFQINEDFRLYRVARWGAYDPHNPIDAAIIAGLIYMANRRELEPIVRRIRNVMHNSEKAEYLEMLTICSYRQGVGGVIRNGPTSWYSERVYKIASR